MDASLSFNWFVRREVRRLPRGRLLGLLIVAWFGGCVLSQPEHRLMSRGWTHVARSAPGSVDVGPGGGASAGDVDSAAGGVVGSELKFEITRQMEFWRGRPVFESYAVKPAEAVERLNPDVRADLLREIAELPEMAPYRGPLLDGESRWSRRYRLREALLAAERLGLAIGVTLPIVAFVVLARADRLWRRHERGACLSCGYDLRGVVVDRCPECGVGVHSHVLNG